MTHLHGAIRRTRRVAGLLGLLSTFLLATFAVPAQEQPPDGTPTPEAALEALFTAGPEAVTFTDEFAAAVSVDQLRTILRSLAERLGPFRGIEGTDSPFTVRFVNGTATADVVLSDGAIAGLRFRQITPATEDLAAAVTRFMDRPGEVALSVRRNGEEIVARNADRPLAVGSSFKLAVLRTLELAVAAGDARWDEVVHLDHGERSLPSGVTQDWPDGTAATLETLAVLMISMSDNTATDALIHRLGRDAVDAAFPGDTPVLTTREAFLLKAADAAEMRERYLNGDSAARRRILRRGLSGALPPPDLFAGAPVHPGIEWFAPASGLTQLIDRIDRTDVLAVSAGPFDAGSWQYLGYKGGSEPGVVNMTLRLVTTDGTRYSVSATQNRGHHAVDLADFVQGLNMVLAHLQ